MNGWTKDLGLALRGLARSPGLAALAVLSLAIGVGANTTILGLVGSAVWHRLPAPDADSLVRIYELRKGEYDRLSYANFLDLREQSGGVFDDVLVHRLENFGLRVGDTSEVIYGELVSGSYFDTLEIRPAAGRLFSDEEASHAGSAPVVVISDDLWRRRFDRDPSIVGGTLRLDDHPFTVVGVAEPSFQGTKYALGMDVWVPAPIWARVAGWSSEWNRARDRHGWLAVGRLRPGLGLETAEGTLRPAVDRLIEADPEANRNLELRLFTEVDGALDPHAAGLPRLLGMLAMGAASIVLLVSCANVASLLYARSLQRRREIGIRHVLGASRLRLVRQLLSESAVLAFFGAVLGIAAAFFTTRFFFAFLPVFPYRFVLDPRPDARVVTIAIVAAAVSALVAGLAPALRASGGDALLATRDGAPSATVSRKSRRSLDLVVVSMVALSFVSLSLSGLFLRSLGRVRQVDPGFQTAGRLVASFDVSLAGDPDLAAADYATELIDEVSALPQVAAAAVSSLMPLGDRSSSSTLYADDRVYGVDDHGIEAWRASVTDGYFSVMGTALRRGRPFDAFDRADSSRVAIVNQTLAERLWPGEDPVGRRLRFERLPGEGTLEVVGVAEDGRYGFLNEQKRPAFFVPFVQVPEPGSVLIARARGDASALGPDLRRTMAAVDPRVPILDLATADHYVTNSLWLFRLGAGMAASLGVLALLLSAAGLFGVISYGVSRRRHELGIRVALGAQGRRLMAAVLGRGLLLTGIGVGSGLVVVGAAGSLLRNLLFGIAPWDPTTLLVVGLTLGVVAGAATLVPALSAARSDPSTTLRAS